MLSCRPLHFYIKTDAGTFLVNKNFKMTTFTLTGITKRVNFIYYHVAYTFSDGRIRYTEMRHENICKDKIYLKCVNKKNCKVFLSIFVKNPIRIEKNGTTNFRFHAGCNSRYAHECRKLWRIISSTFISLR